MRTRRFWILVLVIATGVATFARYYRVGVVVGNSMQPTYESGDLVLVERLAYRTHPPADSDVVLARVGGQHVLKRIVGLPGQAVDVRSGVVHVDGAVPSCSYPVLQGDIDIDTGVLATDRYAILGDNRAETQLRTLHSVVSRADLVGKVVMHLRLRRRSQNQVPADSASAP